MGDWPDTLIYILLIAILRILYFRLVPLDFIACTQRINALLNESTMTVQIESKLQMTKNDVDKILNWTVFKDQETLKEKEMLVTRMFSNGISLRMVKGRNGSVRGLKTRVTVVSSMAI